MIQRLGHDFYLRDVLELAPDLLGKKLVRRISGQIFEYVITEVEAYRGSEDLACHASKGRTARTEAMYMEGGHIYMYFIYGMYWMFNIVASGEGVPQGEDEGPAEDAQEERANKTDEDKPGCLLGGRGKETEPSVRVPRPKRASSPRSIRPISYHTSTRSRH